MKHRSLLQAYTFSLGLWNRLALSPVIWFLLAAGCSRSFGDSPLNASLFPRRKGFWLLWACACWQLNFPRITFARGLFYPSCALPFLRACMSIRVLVRLHPAAVHLARRFLALDGFWPEKRFCDFLH